MNYRHSKSTLAKALASPPAAITAAAAASDNFLLFSCASLSLLAFVLDDPLGATPLRILVASWGVKFTKDISLSLDCDESDEATDAFAWERMDPLLAFLRDDPGRDEAFDIDLGADFEDVAARAADAAAAAAERRAVGDGV